VRVLAVIAAVLLLAACGGGGGGTRLSRDAYVAKANALCAKLAKERKQLGAPSGLAAIPAYIDKALPPLDSTLKQLHALRPPADMEQSVKELLQKADDVRRLLPKLRSAAKKGDAVAVAQVGSQAAQLNNEIQSRARQLALTSCTLL
jgi:hypothetical protein